MGWREFLDLDQQLRRQGLQEQGLALVWTDGQTEAALAAGLVPG